MYVLAAVVAGLLWHMTTPTVVAARQVNAGGFAPFVGTWGAHGRGIQITSVGRDLDGFWEIAFAIIDGGNALIAFTHVTGNTLHGRILATSDPRTIPIASPAQLVLERYGMGLLVLGTESMDLCGPHYLEEAPPEFQQTFPCGA